MKKNTTYLPLIGKYLSGAITKKERVELFKWVEANPDNQRFFDDMVNLWGMSEEYTQPFQTDTAKAWQQIEQKLGNSEQKLAATASSNGSAMAITNSSLNREKPRSAKVIPLYRQLWRIAAVFLIGIGLSYTAYQYFFPEYIVLATAEDERIEKTLPDGSKAWLNENSTLTYKRVFQERLVVLEGEAYFDVEHLDKEPFEIRSGQAKTVVLGTTFNVRAYPKENRIEVTVEEGKVAVSEESVVSKPKIIKDGESAVFYKESKKVEKEKQQIPNAIGWKKKKLEFSGNTTIKEVVESLRRYFNIEIEVENERILNCDFTNTGSLSNPKLETILQTLEFVLNIESREEGDKLILSGDGCSPKNN